MTYKLSDLDIEEVSLVDKGAIREKFLIIKRDSSEDKNTNKGEESMDVTKMSDEQLDEMIQEELEKAQKEESQKAGLDESGMNTLRRMTRRMMNMLGGTQKNEDNENLDTEEDEMEDTQKNTDGVDASAIAKAVKEELQKEFKEELAKAQERAEKAESEVASLRDESELRKARDYVTSHEWLGDVEKNASLYVKMSKAFSDEDFSEWLERENANAAQMTKSQMFEEIGTHLSKSLGDENVESEVRKALKEGKSFDEIANDIIDPKDYDAYMKAHEKAINRKLHSM